MIIHRSIFVSLSIIFLLFLGITLSSASTNEVLRISTTSSVLPEISQPYDVLETILIPSLPEEKQSQCQTKIEANKIIRELKKTVKKDIILSKREAIATYRTNFKAAKGDAEKRKEIRNTYTEARKSLRTEKQEVLKLSTLADYKAKGIFTGEIMSQCKTYITGPKGGCYYLSSNNNKEYVDRSICK